MGRAASREKATASGFRFWLPLVTVATSMFVMVIDTTMMVIAIPAITKDLGTSVTGVQSAIALYPLISGALMLTGATIGPRLGIRRGYIGAAALFGVGAVLSALAPSLAVLVLGWSVLEGIAAAILVPLNYAIVNNTYEGKARVTGFAVLAAVGAVAAAVGPVLGGFLTTFATWRYGFALQVVGVGVAALLAFELPAGAKTSGARAETDWIGTLLSITAFCITVVGIMLAGRFGWWTPRRTFELGGQPFQPFGLSIVPTMIGIGAAIFVVFLHWERRRRHDGAAHIMRPGLLRNRQFTLGFLVEGCANVGFQGLLFVLPVFMQTVNGMSAFEAGVALIPFSVGALTTSLLAPGLAERVQARRLVQLGLVAIGAGLLWYQDVVSPAAGGWSLYGAYLLIGAGAGLVLALASATSMSAVQREESASAGAVNRSFQRITRSLGTAIVGTVFLVGVYDNVIANVARTEGVTLNRTEQTRLAADLEDDVNRMEEAQPKTGRSEAEPPGAPEQQLLATSAIKANRDAMGVAVAVILLSLLLSTFLQQPTAPKERRQPARAEARAAT